MAATITVEASESSCKPNLRLSNFIIIGSITLLTTLTSAIAGAAEWKLTPKIDYSEVYSDNIRLQSAGMEESSYITQISPGLSLTGTGDRLHLLANYSMQNLYYSNSINGVKTNHLLNARATTELAKNLFFLDGTVNVHQQDVNPFAPQTNNNYSLTDNRTEVRTYSISPYFRHRLDNMASTELRFTRDSFSSSKKNAANSDADQIQFNLKSGPEFKTLKWGVQYDNQKIHYSQLSKVEFESGKINLTYQMASQLGITSSVGYEHNNYAHLGTSNSSGTSWSAGLNWTPSERTSLNVSAGHRYFGATYALTASYRSRMSVFSAGYNEDVTTTRGQFFIPATTDTSAFLNQLWKTSIPDDNTRQQLIDNFIRDTGLPNSLAVSTNTFTNRVFLQKNLHASTAFTGVQNTLLLTLFNTSREALSTGAVDTLLLGANNPALLDKTRQTGITALWNWQISPRTSASINLGHTRVTSLTTGLKNNNKSAHVTISRQLHPKLKASLEFRKMQKDTNKITGSFQENAITLFIMLGF